jgi:hypothetical protein
MTPVPQVPRNPELEALNDYFNQQRTAMFARQQERAVLPEALSKQAEMVANQIVRDEIERRSGVRKSVLEATGMTPAQIQVQMAQETLGSVNPRVLDMRDKQVQDAVNLYYMVNNLPIPATAPMTTAETPAAIKTEPKPEGMTPLATDGVGVNVEQPTLLPEDDAMLDRVVGQREGEDFPVSATPAGPAQLPEYGQAMRLTKRALADLIVANNIRDPAVLGVRGERLSAATLERVLDKELLARVVEDHVARGFMRPEVAGASGGAAGGTSARDA